MNNQEKLAREWAERAKTREVSSPEEQAAADHILATTTPPTMADAEWDDEKHNLAGATTPRGNDVVMMWCDDEDTGNIITGSAEWAPKDLTPNGKKYELREVMDEHPETLSTVEDYENAPVGTIVAMSGTASVWRKLGGKWKRGDYRYANNAEMEGVHRTVMRWGWGE